MILEELCAYYERARAGDASTLGAYGFQFRRLDLVIEIHEDGSFARLLPTKNLSAHQDQRFLLPMEKKRARQIAPNLLWDHGAYVLGLGEGDQHTSKKRLAFAAQISELAAAHPQHRGLAALDGFYQQGHWKMAAQVCDREAGGLRNPTLSFRLCGQESLIAEDQALHPWLLAQLEEEGAPRLRCMISGEWDTLALVHPTIKGLKGALGVGATLVSFQQESSRFYGKKQGENAPIGKRTAFAYTSALNELLRPGSDRVVHFDELSLVFWAESATEWEEGFAQFLSLKCGQESYEEFYKKLASGHWESDTSSFFILALSVQKTRISVRYWQKFSIQEMQQHLRKFFLDLHIIHAPYEAQNLSLYAIAAAMSDEEKASAIESSRFLELFHAIFDGKMYPQSFFYITMGLIRKEKRISYHRAAIVKAYLVRSAKYYPVQEEVGVALDPALTQVAYALGRLFAVLERLQEEALQHASNLRERYYTTASTSPAAVFPHILRQKNTYLARMSNRTLRERFERDIAEIFERIQDIPISLSLTDQGRFVIGYYHQRQEYFTAPKRRRDEEQVS